ncbi:MAG: hypothetical protein RL293_1033, partial [Bacteroidota bacterium]
MFLDHRIILYVIQSKQGDKSQAGSLRRTL